MNFYAALKSSNQFISTNKLNKSNTECGIVRPTNAFTWDHIHYLEVSYQYPVKGTMLIFKLVCIFVEYPKSIASEILVVLRPYQIVKSIQQAVFNLPRSQAISCTGYNVNLQTAVAAILVFVECPKSIPSKVLVALRPYQNMKSIQQAVFNIPRSKAIFCIGYNVNLQSGACVAQR